MARRHTFPIPADTVSILHLCIRRDLASLNQTPDNIPERIGCCYTCAALYMNAFNAAMNSHQGIRSTPTNGTADSVRKMITAQEEECTRRLRLSEKVHAELFEAFYHVAQGEYHNVPGILAALDPDSRKEFTETLLQEIKDAAVGAVRRDKSYHDKSNHEDSTRNATHNFSRRR
jgi:hypothetical protein